MKIALLGFDREGQAALRFLAREPEFRDAEIWILDKNKDLQIPDGTRARLGEGYLVDLDKFDMVFRTPGARYYSPEIQQAIARGATITSGTKMFFDRCPGKIVGITGTKGKGTTTTLIYEILKAGGKKVFIAGNIGKPALDILPEMDEDSWAVLELSSFQLIDLKKSPHVGVALMVTEEHLDWHADAEEYTTAKSNVVRWQSPADYAVLAEDYPKTAAYRALTSGDVFTFSRNHPVKKGAWVEDNAFWFSDGSGKEKICDVASLHIPGQHNWENASAAITAGKILGIKNDAVAGAINTFHGLQHRLEFVAEVNGARYYDDSYSTMPDATRVAIEAFDAPKILILGGSSKNADFTELGKVISASKSVKAIIGIGVEWLRIKEHIHAPNIQLIEGCKNMQEIIAAAHAAAKPKDVVILSPGCASFGMFKSYTDRGDQFKAEVGKLSEGA
jgi:UDP-N-acetylmuramoylalanine--D-glutamate ligase